MNLRCETDQLFVPGRKQIFSFIQTELAFVRELQPTILVLDELAIVSGCCSVSGSERRDATVRSTPSCFRSSAYDFQIRDREREDLQLREITGECFALGVDEDGFGIVLQ